MSDNESRYQLDSMEVDSLEKSIHGINSKNPKPPMAKAYMDIPVIAHDIKELQESIKIFDEESSVQRAANTLLEKLNSDPNNP